MPIDLSRLSDEELVASLKKLVREEREQLVLVLKHLNEMDRREYALGAGFPSLFEYAVRELRYAPGEAARRIHAARAAKKFPIVYRALERGLLSLTTASLLAPHLKWENYRRLIRAASGKSTRDVEALTANLTPTSAEPAEKIKFIGIAPTTPNEEARATGDLFDSKQPGAEESTSIAGPDASNDSPQHEPAPPPASPVRRVHFSFTADEAMLRDVERARQLLWHKSPAGKLERVFAEALKALLKAIDPARRTPRAERSPRPDRADGSHRKIGRSRARRAIPRAVQDAVWRRDGGSCAFLSPDGRRCGERSGLEFDHVLPWARGGASDEDNLRLLCRAHNALAARRAFGAAAIEAVLANPPPS